MTDSDELGRLVGPGEDQFAPGQTAENYVAADRELSLTPQERNLYVHHLHNLWNGGGYRHPDGSRSTAYSTTVGIDDRTYLIPRVWNNMILGEDEALETARGHGLDSFPSYSSRQEAEDRYRRMHDYMDRDTEGYIRGDPFRGEGRATAADAAAISRMESGGRYDAVGPETQGGHRAIGKYQVMDYNVGPWTEEVLGRRMTAEEFKRDRAAQDEVFAVKFGRYKELYGAEGAARAWIGGPGLAGGSSARDALGTSVNDYGRRYAGLMNQEQPGNQYDLLHSMTFGLMGNPSPMSAGVKQSGSYPSNDDLAEARRVDQSYGDPRSGFYGPGGRIRKIDVMAAASAINQEKLRQVPWSEVDQGTADSLYLAALAANKSAIASLGFDPRSMVLSPPENKELTVAGVYSPKSDSLWADLKYNSAMVHESVHRGIEILRSRGLLAPSRDQETPDRPFVGRREEENIVRGVMLRTFGDVESELGDVSAKQVREARYSLDNFTRYTTNLDALERMAADQIKLSRPAGPR